MFLGKQIEQSLLIFALSGEVCRCPQCSKKFRPVEGVNTHAPAVSPIISGGDITGAVAFLGGNDDRHVTDDPPRCFLENR